MRVIDAYTPSSEFSIKCAWNKRIWFGQTDKRRDAVIWIMEHGSHSIIPIICQLVSEWRSMCLPLYDFIIKYLIPKNIKRHENKSSMLLKTEIKEKKVNHFKKICGVQKPCFHYFMVSLIACYIAFVFCNLQMDHGFFKFPDIKFNTCEESGEIYCSVCLFFVVFLHLVELDIILAVQEWKLIRLLCWCNCLHKPQGRRLYFIYSTTLEK